MKNAVASDHIKYKSRIVLLIVHPKILEPIL